MASPESKIARPGKTDSLPGDSNSPSSDAVAKTGVNSAVASAKDVSDTAFVFAAPELPALARSFAEQSLSQSREAYARMKAAAEQTSSAMEESFGTARDGLRDAQIKT